MSEMEASGDVAGLAGWVDVRGGLGGGMGQVSGGVTAGLTGSVDIASVDVVTGGHTSCYWRR